MGFICAALLMHMDELDAFWLFDKLMSSQKYAMRRMYESGLIRMKYLAYEFQILLRDQLPELSLKLENGNCNPVLYLYEWYMTMFTSKDLPWDLTLRVW